MAALTPSLNPQAASFSPTSTRRIGPIDIAEGVEYLYSEGVVGRNRTLTFTCDTKCIPLVTEYARDFDGALLTRPDPERAQLNILTGPRLDLDKLREVVKWFRRCLGERITKIRSLQVVLIRCGECINNRWTIPALHLTLGSIFRPHVKQFLLEFLDECLLMPIVTWDTAMAGRVCNVFFSRAIEQAPFPLGLAKPR
jgi:hypothetical protein